MSTSPATAPVAQKKRSRAGELIGVVVILGVVIGAAFFYEQLSAFFSLKMWDKGAPARAAEQFVAAGKKGDKAGAKALLAANFQDLEIDGKWRGYYMVSMPGRMDYDFQALAPAGEPKAQDVEFFTIGKGWVELKIPDSTNTPIKYRMELVDGTWKVMDIFGGKPPASAPKPPPSKNDKPAGQIPGAPKK